MNALLPRFTTEVSGCARSLPNRASPGTKIKPALVKAVRLGKLVTPSTGKKFDDRTSRLEELNVTADASSVKVRLAFNVVSNCTFAERIVREGLATACDENSWDASRIKT